MSRNMLAWAWWRMAAGLVVACLVVSAPVSLRADADIVKKLAALTAADGEEEAEDDDAGDGMSVLATKTLWRMRVIRETPEVIDQSGQVVHGSVRTKTNLGNWFRGNKGATLPEDQWEVVAVKPADVATLPTETPADWMMPDFDDTSWTRRRAPLLSNFWSPDQEWKAILLRGAFGVTDPAKAGDLTFSMSFRGGAVVYLNGQEVARAYMPEGEVSLATPALPYPKSADLDPDGFLLDWGRQTTRRALAGRPQEIKDRVESRTRRMQDVVIPARHLRPGVNVLAVAVRRAPTPGWRYVTRRQRATSVGADHWWFRLGLLSIRLRAEPTQAVVGNVGPVSGRGLTIWNQNILEKVTPDDFSNPFAPLRPVRIVGVRNGVFAGQVVLGDDKPIEGLSVTASDLKGPGVIPSAAVRVRYALPDGAGNTFDTLEEVVPTTVPVSSGGGLAVQPLWITVEVPKEARAGEYTGTLTVAAKGVEPREVPLSVGISDWTLPPGGEFAVHMDFMQSPDTVAMAYGVPMWSDEHMRLLDRTFALLAGMGNKTLFVPAIRRTHMGNEHAMVRWIRDDEGELQPEFTIVEKYLDAALKHMTHIPGVILYCWEPPSSQGHAGGTGTAARMHDKPILYTLYDPDEDEYMEARGPDWGTPEARVFWKKVTDGIQPVLAKRGLQNSLLFGLLGDHRATKQAMDDICNGVPNAKWAIHSHYRAESWEGYEMGMWIALWGLGYRLTDPANGYSFGWSNPRWSAYFPREMSLRSSLTEYRVKAEAYIGAKRGRDFVTLRSGPKGLGRLGADFWVVLKDGRGRPRSTLAGRYPESAWGQLNINNGVPRVLGRGQNGPVPTVRSETFREAAQDIEVRVYIEKALLDAEAEARLGKDLMQRCRAALDERIRFANRCSAYQAAGQTDAWFIGSGWQDRARLLYELAAEVSQKFKDRPPEPVLGDAEEPEAEPDE